MSSTFVMVLDGFLRRDGNALNIQGVHLYQALCSSGRVAILCGPDQAEAEWFLKTNGLIKHAYLVPEDPMSSPTKAGRRMAQITYLRSKQSHIEFVFECDPEIATELFAEGIAVNLYLHPQYTRPSFRPDYKGTAVPWDALTQEIHYQEKMKAETVYSDLD